MFRKKNSSITHTINFYDDNYYLIEQPQNISETETNNIEKTSDISTFELKTELTKFRVDLSRLTRKIDNTSSIEPDLSGVNDNLRSIMENIQRLEIQIKSKEAYIPSRNDPNEEQEKYQKKIGREIIEVIDSFDRIIKLMGTEILNTSVGTGILAIRQQLEQKLTLWNFSTIDDSGLFNPNRHMAVATDWDPNVPGDTILSTHLRGYLYKGLIFRNAEVTVNRQPKA